jgi:hypothetical protein
MPRNRVGHLWFLHAQSVPRDGLRERRDLEPDTEWPSPCLLRKALVLVLRVFGALGLVISGFGLASARFPVALVQHVAAKRFAALVFAEADGRLAALRFPLCFSGPAWQRIGPFFLGLPRGLVGLLGCGACLCDCGLSFLGLAVLAHVFAYVVSEIGSRTHKSPSHVRFRRQTGKHLLTSRLTGFDRSRACQSRNQFSMAA